jgi:hypothetical protein
VPTEQTTDQSPAESASIALAGSRPLFAEELRSRVSAGARIVRFEFCFSLVVFTIRRQSPLYLTDSWQERYIRGLWYSLVAIVLGPWGVPWGLIFTPWSVWVNLTGGVDETELVMARLNGTAGSHPNAGGPVPASGNSGTT